LLKQKVYGLLYPHLSATIISSRYLYKGGEGRGENVFWYANRLIIHAGERCSKNGPVRLQWGAHRCQQKTSTVDVLGQNTSLRDEFGLLPV